jgi:hypothetical protein
LPLSSPAAQPSQFFLLSCRCNCCAFSLLRRCSLLRSTTHTSSQQSGSHLSSPQFVHPSNCPVKNVPHVTCVMWLCLSCCSAGVSGTGQQRMHPFSRRLHRSAHPTLTSQQL